MSLELVEGAGERDRGRDQLGGAVLRDGVDLAAVPATRTPGAAAVFAVSRMCTAYQGCAAGIERYRAITLGSCSDIHSITSE